MGLISYLILFKYLGRNIPFSYSQIVRVKMMDIKIKDMKDS